MAVHLSPARFCANCLGKNLPFHEEILGFSLGHCSCPDCQTGRFSRCGGCHLVPYCSRECQLQHRSQHEKLCQDLARRERTTTEAGTFYLLQPVSTFYSRFWLGDLSVLSLGINIPLPTKLPKIVWIDASLANLLNLVNSVGKEIRDIDGEILESLSELIKCYMERLSFYSSWQNDGKVTELYIAACVFEKNWAISIDLCSLDRKIRDKFVQNEVWEALIFQWARFCQSLRMVKYKLINMKSIKKKRPTQYKALKPFYESGLKMLESSVGRLDGQTSRVSLPPGTDCVGCGADLGEKEAQLAAYFHDKKREEHKMISVPGTPCVLDMSDTAKNIVVCGHHEACNVTAKALYEQILRQETEALLAVLPDTKVCQGCSRHSLGTHRCSRCRAARYCSQDCLNQSWGEHRIRCRDFTRPGCEELYVTKKLDEKARKIQAKECLQQLRYYDPLLGSASADLAAEEKFEEVD